MNGIKNAALFVVYADTRIIVKMKLTKHTSLKFLTFREHSDEVFVSTGL